MKKIVALALASILVLSILAGCSGGGGSQSTAAPSGSQATQASQATQGSQATQAPGGDEKHVVSFWDENAGDKRTEFYMVIKGNFEKDNPGWELDYLGLTQSEALSKYLTAIEGGSTPDTGCVNSNMASTVIAQKHCVELSDMLAASPLGEQMDKNYVERARTYAKDNGFYMMPTSTNFNTLWINTDMFEEAGVEPPKTWDDFFEIVPKLTTADHYAYIIRGGSGSANALIDFIYSYMGETDLFKDGKCTINDPMAVEFVEKYLGMYGVNTAESDITADYKEMTSKFDSGASAMFTHNLGSYPNHIETLGEGHFQACPLPCSPKNGKYVNYAGSLTGILMFDSANQEDAWHWIEYLCGHESNSFWNQSIGQMPTNTAAYSDEWLTQAQHIQTAITQIAADNTVAYVAGVFLPNYGQIQNTYIEPAIQQALSGEITAQELCDLWAEKLQEAYDAYMAN